MDRNIFLETFSDTFPLYNKVDKKSFLVKNPKGKIELQQQRQNQGPLDP